MSINNADVIKLLRSDRSSDTRALLFYFIIIILFYFILFYFILFYFILFYFILFYFILFYFILFYFIFVKLLNTSHCSPPPSSLSPPQPALFAAITSGFDHLRFRSLPVSITSGSHLVLFADPSLIWRKM